MRKALPTMAFAMACIALPARADQLGLPASDVPRRLGPAQTGR